MPPKVTQSLRRYYPTFTRKLTFVTRTLPNRYSSVTIRYSDVTQPLLGSYHTLLGLYPTITRTLPNRYSKVTIRYSEVTQPLLGRHHTLLGLYPTVTRRLPTISRGLPDRCMTMSQTLATKLSDHSDSTRPLLLGEYAAVTTQAIHLNDVIMSEPLKPTDGRGSGG